MLLFGKKIFSSLKKSILLIATTLVKFYRRFISPLKPPTCRFYPTCSQYTLEALEKYGIIKGTYKAIIRICKCHPFNPGGYDPVK